ncbi:MAG: biotin--[acetyl-CoA-carboxylase] ligase, partial [Halanaerobiales bacterium]
TAVWKYIKKLREAGYEIDSRSSRGYRMKKIPDKLMPEEIILGLDDYNSGWNVRTYSSVDSTNDKARKLIEEGAGEGTVVVAERQTKGRGRRGRGWFSPPGTGLWFSVVTEPDFSPEKSPLLTVAALLAVHDSLLEQGFSATVKWPNDILLESKKVCGILSELILQPDTINFAIIGIGINVNQEDFPSALRERATSLRKVSSEKVGRVNLLQSILNEFVFYYNLLPDKQEQLVSCWKERLQLLGQKIVIESGGKKYRGIAVDISCRGELLLKDNRGDILSFWAGDTSLVKEG